MKQPKINAALRDKLFSPESEIVISAIRLLEEQGNRNYLPILFELLVAHSEKKVRVEILKLLGNIKDKESVEIFTEALKTPKFAPIRKEIATACWQTGMDFSAHLDIFADLVINENWETAFEAFTVIENTEEFPPQEQLKDLKLKVAGALKTADEQKQYFLEEILRMT